MICIFLLAFSRVTWAICQSNYAPRKEIPRPFGITELVLSSDFWKPEHHAFIQSGVWLNSGDKRVLTQIHHVGSQPRFFLSSISRVYG